MRGINKAIVLFPATNEEGADLSFAVGVKKRDPPAGNQIRRMIRCSSSLPLYVLSCSTMGKQ